MIKKCVLIIIFFLSYSTTVSHPFAETDNVKETKEVENIDSNQESDPLKKQKEIIDSDLTCTKDIPFTPAQKKRLDQIYHRIYMDYVALIETYTWSGALTQDQKLIRYKMLKNYILTFQKRNYKWCSEFEEDEWEEEWFNSDND
jgi:hypothetical protein